MLIFFLCDSVDARYSIAARADAPASPMRKGLGRMGSCPVMEILLRLGVEMFSEVRIEWRILLVIVAMYYDIWATANHVIPGLTRDPVLN